MAVGGESRLWLDKFLQCLKKIDIKIILAFCNAKGESHESHGKLKLCLMKLGVSHLRK